MSSSSSFVYRDEVHARCPPTSRDPTESVFDYPAFDSAAPITSPRVLHTFFYKDAYYSPYSTH